MAVKIETTMNPYKQVMIFETVKDYIEYLRELEMLNTIVEQVVEEPVIENIVEPVIENIEPIELVIENVIEEEPIEILTKPNVITYDMGIEALKEKYTEVNSYKAYLSKYTTMFNKNDNLSEMDVDKLIKFIDTKTTSPSTKKSYYSCIKFILSYFNFDNELVERMTALNEKMGQQIILDNNKKPKQSIDIAYDGIKSLQEKHDELLTQISDEYDHKRSMCALSYLLLNFGAERPAELMKVVIRDADHDELNYVNINTKQMVINEHKNKNKSKQARVFDLDDKFIDLVKSGLGLHLILKEKLKEGYGNVDSMKAMVLKFLNVNIYEIRKMKASIAIKNKPVEEVQELSKVQGHSLQTMKESYQKYV